MNWRLAWPLAAIMAISAADAALPRLLLTPLLVIAVLIAGELLSPRPTAAVALLAGTCAIPLGAADHVFATVTQVWILAAIFVMGSVATRISRSKRVISKEP